MDTNGRKRYTTEQVRHFQDILLKARRARGLTQTQVAEQIGVSQTLISALERGPSVGMRFDELLRVLTYYGIEANEVAVVLGYTDTTPRRDDDPGVREFLTHLRAVPEHALDDILTALDLMTRGALASA